MGNKPSYPYPWDIEPRPLVGDCGFYKSEGEYGFKYLRDGQVAALYIPEGTAVHIEGNMHDDTETRLKSGYYPRKRRAELAYVVAIGNQRIGNCDFQKTGVNEWKCIANLTIDVGVMGVSNQDPNFIYHIGRIVRPETRFDEHDEACASGIHYYDRPLVYSWRGLDTIDASLILFDWFDVIKGRRPKDELEARVKELLKEENCNG